MSKVSAIASDSGYNPRASEETAALFAFALSLDSGASLYLLRSSRSTVPLPGGKYTLIDAGGGQDFPVQKLAAALDGILPKEDSLWLFSSGGTGRDLALFFAARRGIAAAVNAVGLEASEGGYLVKRMAYGGCLTAGLSIPACAAAAFSKGALPSVRPSGPDEPAETLAIDPGGSPAEVRFEAKENPLPKARKVIACGRGVSTQADLERIGNLASRLGAELAVSRPVASNGWVGRDRMLGISGEVTAPEACLLLGVSGTPAFLYGISGAKHVVAVNTDPDAAVFSRAEAGTQADWKVICAALEGALDK